MLRIRPATLNDASGMAQVKPQTGRLPTGGNLLQETGYVSDIPQFHNTDEWVSILVVVTSAILGGGRDKPCPICVH